MKFQTLEIKQWHSLELSSFVKENSPMTIVPMDASQASQGFELGSTRYIGQHGDQTASTEADM